jgi:hypothetical protein
MEDHQGSPPSQEKENEYQMAGVMTAPHGFPWRTSMKPSTGWTQGMNCGKSLRSELIPERLHRTSLDQTASEPLVVG